MHGFNRARLATWSILGLAIFLGSGVQQALAASGRDITFGYTWRDTADGAVGVVAGFDSVTRVTPANNAPPIGPVALPFASGFPFYGTNYAQMWISENGWVSFVDPAMMSFPAPATIPTAGGPVALVTPLWNDVTIGPGGRISYGPSSAFGAFRVQYSGTDPTTGGTAFINDILLFADGRIQFQYAAAPIFGGGTVGIEAASATDGIQIAGGGVVQPGINPAGGYVIDFVPPAILPPTCASIPGGACRMINGTSPAAGTNVLFYGCSFSQFAARESVYSFDVTQTSTVDLTLTSATGLTMFLLSECNERSCVSGPATLMSRLLGPGTYFVAVDGAGTANEGAFTLDIACTPLGTPLACDSMASGTTIGGRSNLSNYPCAAPRVHAGEEAYYSINIAAMTNLTIRLDFASADLDLLVLRPSPGGVSVADCVAFGDTQVTVWNALPGEYILVVDAAAGISGDFDISTTCGIQLDCSSVRGTLDLGAMRAVTISGNTTGGMNTVDTYGCDPMTLFDGPDEIWEVVLPQPGYIGVSQFLGYDGLAYPILSACNEGACLSMGGKGQNCAGPLPAGTYYLMVDSTMGNSGPYETNVFYEEVFNRWDVCEDPQGATMLTDTSSPFWNFNDAAYCHTDPTSRNFPNGCSFAMYVTVRCGTAMHLPLFDVEGGHVRVFDLLQGQYVFLTAISGGGWFQQGTDIDWSLQDCAGSDPRWNEVITDIFFERPTGLCGVFRLEFPTFSGFVWELYANCAGDRTPQFNIHDSMCSAMSEYLPLPDISIVSATANATCPDVMIDYELRNNGCAGVTDFPLGLYDDATLVTLHLVPFIPANGSITGGFMATFPTVPTGMVTLQLDPMDTTAECTEVPGAACSASAGLRTLQIAGCTNMCNVLAQAVATPSRICAGDASTVSGAASSSSQCPGGVLEYQLREGATVLVPWQVGTDFAGLTPGTTTTYTVDVRCADVSVRDTCLASRNVTVDVDRRPDLDPASVIAVDIAACNPGIRIDWTAATFYGTLGTGTYNIYRSLVSCADAVLQSPIAIGLTVPTFSDVTAMSDTPYYYVVEAEDSTTGSACLPRGPRNGGAVRRVDCNQGTCVAVTDSVLARADLLPRVGPTLRVGGSQPGGGRRYSEFFVEMEWMSDRPLVTMADEHFHVLRSEMPGAGFVLYSSEPPRLQLPYFLDLGADDPSMNALPLHVWHYLILTADACDNDNQAFDNLP